MQFRGSIFATVPRQAALSAYDMATWKRDAKGALKTRKLWPLIVLKRRRSYSSNAPAEPTDRWNTN